MEDIYKHYPKLAPKDKQGDKVDKDSNDDELDIPGFPKVKSTDCEKDTDTKKVDGHWKVL